MCPEPEPQDRLRHEVQRQLDLVQTVGAIAHDTRLGFHLSARDRSAVDGRLRSAGSAKAGGARWLVVHPGASAPSRRWPVERFAAVAAQLSPISMAWR